MPQNKKASQSSVKKKGKLSIGIPNTIGYFKYHRDYVTPPILDVKKAPTELKLLSNLTI